MRIVRANERWQLRGENCGALAFRCTWKLRPSDHTKLRESLCSLTERSFFSAPSCRSGKGRRRRSGNWLLRNSVSRLTRSPSTKVTPTKFHRLWEPLLAVARPSAERLGEWLRVSWSKKY